MRQGLDDIRAGYPGRTHQDRTAHSRLDNSIRRPEAIPCQQGGYHLVHPL